MFFKNSSKPEINWNAQQPRVAGMFKLLTQMQKMSKTMAISYRTETSQE